MNKLIKFSLFFLLCSAALISQAQKNTINQLTKKEKKQGWVLLFDGKTSAGWMKANGQPFQEKGWQISNGSLTVLESQKGGDIVTVDEYADFELSVDFLLSKTANSGIKYFFTNYTTGGNLGMEYQVMDDDSASDNKLANHLCGSLYDIFPPDETIKKTNAIGQWNTAKIISKGKHVEHWLNGIKILEFERGNESYLIAVAKSKYKTVPVFGTVEKGKILLQEHGHEVSFRNIKIRKL
jgi:hypothetical protein